MILNCKISKSLLEQLPQILLNNRIKIARVSSDVKFEELTVGQHYMLQGVEIHTTKGYTNCTDPHFLFECVNDDDVIIDLNGYKMNNCSIYKNEDLDFPMQIMTHHLTRINKE